MSLTVTDTGGRDFKPVPAGTHRAICTLLVDMGVQPGGKFAPKPKIYIRFEIPDEKTEWTDKDGTTHTGPMVIGKKYTASLSEKANLRKDLEGWRGRSFTAEELKGFSLKAILGAPAMIGVVHQVGQDGKTYAQLATIMGLPKGTEKPKAAGALLAYDISEHDPRVFDQLPGWLQEQIKDRVPEEDDVPAPKSADDFSDDVPF